VIICFDFDGTLHDPDNREAGYRMGKPFVGAVELCTVLAAQGHQLLVHSCRATQDHHRGHVYDWLRYFKFPNMLVCVQKPKADVYVDNKALRFDGDWSHLAVALHQLGFLHGTPRASDEAGQHDTAGSRWPGDDGWGDSGA